MSTAIVGGGEEGVYDGGTTKATTVSGWLSGTASLLYVDALCRASGVTIGSGGRLEVDGDAFGVTVLSGGTVAWDVGAVVENLKVRSGGFEELYSGGVLHSATIGNGVTLEVDGSGFSGIRSAVNVTVASGGTIVDRGGVISGLIDRGGRNRGPVVGRHAQQHHDLQRGRHHDLVGRIGQ